MLRAFGSSDCIDRSPVSRSSGPGKLSNSGIEVMETPGAFHITKRWKVCMCGRVCAVYRMM